MKTPLDSGRTSLSLGTSSPSKGKGNRFWRKFLPEQQPRWLSLVERGCVLLGTVVAVAAILFLFLGKLPLLWMLLILIPAALLFDTGVAIHRHYHGGDPHPFEMRDPLESGMQFSPFAGGSGPRQAHMQTVIPEPDFTKRKPSEEEASLAQARGLRRMGLEALRWIETIFVTLGAFLLIAVWILWLVEGWSESFFVLFGWVIGLFLLAFFARRWRLRKLGVGRKRGKQK